MSSTTPSAAPPLKKGRKPEKSEVMADSVQATNEELRSKLMDVQIEIQQERGKVCKKRKKGKAWSRKLMTVGMYCPLDHDFSKQRKESEANFEELFINVYTG